MAAEHGTGRRVPQTAAAPAAVILAAGLATRMGVPKPTLRLAGTTLLDRCIEAARGGGASPVVVVVSPDLADASPPRADLGYVVNPEPAAGQGRSLALGLAAVPAVAGAAVILLADMPFVDARLIRDLIAEHRRSRAVVTAAALAGRPVPPLVAERTAFDLLAAPRPRRRSALAGLGPRLHLVPVERGRLADVDTPSDYVSVLRAVSALRPAEGVREPMASSQPIVGCIHPNVECSRKSP